MYKTGPWYTLFDRDNYSLIEDAWYTSEKAVRKAAKEYFKDTGNEYVALKGIMRVYDKNQERNPVMGTEELGEE